MHTQRAWVLLEKKFKFRFLGYWKTWVVTPSLLYLHYFYMLVTFVMTILVFILFMFFVIMFNVYFDYILSIASLSLCLCISTHGGWLTLCKSGAYTLFTYGYTLYSGSCGRSRM